MVSSFFYGCNETLLRSSYDYCPSHRSVIQGEDVVSSGNKLCGFMAKGEEAHVTLKQCRAEDDVTYKEVLHTRSVAR